MTHAHQFRVLAIDRATGRALWDRTLREALPHEGGHVTGSLASASPVTDGERLYVAFGSQGIFALDLDGAVLWETRLGFLHTRHAHGEGSSPALHGDILVVNWDHEGDSFVAALDTQSGKERWRTPRNVFASPIAANGRIYVADRNGAVAVLQLGAPPRMIATNHLDDRFSASPVAVGTELYLRGEKSLYCLQKPETRQGAGNGSLRVIHVEYARPDAIASTLAWHRPQG